jgi:hypothetical protein
VALTDAESAQVIAALRIAVEALRVLSSGRPSAAGSHAGKALAQIAEKVKL